MDIKLVQKLYEEDLFPNATPEDIENRKSDKQKELDKKYASLNVGDIVKIKYNGNPTFAKIIKKYEGKNPIYNTRNIQIILSRDNGLTFGDPEDDYAVREVVSIEEVEKVDREEFAKYIEEMINKWKSVLNKMYGPKTT